MHHGVEPHVEEGKTSKEVIDLGYAPGICPILREAMLVPGQPGPRCKAALTAGSLHFGSTPKWIVLPLIIRAGPSIQGIIKGAARAAPVVSLHRWFIW